MHRTNLLDRLVEYVERYPEEQAVARLFSEFVTTHDDCFERTCEVGHITGSAWVVDRSGRRALLTHHRKLDMWIQLGGHSDGDPDTLNVAKREANEESGLVISPVHSDIFDIDRHVIPARKDEPEHFHYDVRFLFQAQSDDFQVTDESFALQWVGVDDVSERTTELSVLRMRTKWLRTMPLVC